MSHYILIGPLRKIHTVDEIVDNGVIEFTSGRIYKIEDPPAGPDRP